MEFGHQQCVGLYWYTQRLQAVLFRPFLPNPSVTCLLLFRCLVLGQVMLLQ